MFETFKIIRINALILLSLFLASSTILAQTSSFNLRWTIISEGGGHVNASNYQLFETFGFPMFGSMSSSSYYLSGGSTVPTNVKELAQDRIKPEKYDLKQNYPNPFNPITNIQFELPEAAYVELIVFNLLGQKLKTLINKEFQAGYHHLIWDGTNENGQQVGSGTYLFLIRATSDNKVLYQDSRKMSFLK